MNQGKRETETERYTERGGEREKEREADRQTETESLVPQRPNPPPRVQDLLE